MKALAVICLSFLAACSVSKFEAGTYRVSTVKNYKGSSTVTFDGLKKEFIMPTDTLKKGYLVYFTDRPGTLPDARSSARNR